MPVHLIEEKVNQCFSDASRRELCDKAFSISFGWNRFDGIIVGD